MWCDAVAGSLFYDAFRNAHALLGGLGDALLVEGERHDVRAVARRDGQYRIHAFACSVHGVDGRDARIAANSRFDGRRIARIYLEGKCRRRLQLFHSTR